MFMFIVTCVFRSHFKVLSMSDLARAARKRVHRTQVAAVAALARSTREELRSWTSPRVVVMYHAKSNALQGRAWLQFPEFCCEGVPLPLSERL